MFSSMYGTFSESVETRSDYTERSIIDLACRTCVSVDNMSGKKSRPCGKVP